MTTEAKQILKDALALPAIDRAALVEELLTSLDRPDPAIDAAWMQEVERRWKAYELGQMKAISEDEVFEGLKDL